jgi:hypothetical protein
MGARSRQCCASDASRQHDASRVATQDRVRRAHHEGMIRNRVFLAVKPPGYAEPSRCGLGAGMRTPRPILPIILALGVIIAPLAAEAQAKGKEATLDDQVPPIGVAPLEPPVHGDSSSVRVRPALAGASVSRLCSACSRQQCEVPETPPSVYVRTRGTNARCRRIRALGTRRMAHFHATGWASGR